MIVDVVDVAYDDYRVIAAAVVDHDDDVYIDFESVCERNSTAKKNSKNLKNSKNNDYSGQKNSVSKHSFILDLWKG